MKRAARWRIKRVGDFALHGGAGPARIAQLGDRIEQHARVRMLGAREEARLWRPLHQPAQIHDADRIADVAHDGQIVRDEQIGQATLALKIAHQVQDLCLHGDIERRGRFVTNEEVRFGGERAGDRDALALATAELVRETGTV